jgi:signal transduction histidine kinase
MICKNLPESKNLAWDGKEAGIEQTDLITLVKHQEQTEAGVPLGQAYQQFQTHQHDYCSVMEAGRVAGLCSRGHLGFLLGHRYGFAIFSHVPVRQHMIEQPLMLRRGMPVREALELALGRQGKAFNEDVILLGDRDEYLGIIPVPALVQLQSALVEERFRVQESMHQRLLTVSRQAGMAEVAIGVLHNVGNVLNSVNVSATLAVNIARDSKVLSLKRVMAILEKNREQLGDYLANDPKGKLVPEFLFQLTHRLQTEQSDQIRELESLAKHIDHIKNIISMQQRYAKVSGILEPVAVDEIVEDGLKMNAEAFTRHGVNLERSFEPVPPVLVDKHKLLQIMVNLIRNAKYAVTHGPNPNKWVRVSIQPLTEERVQIQVKDNGIGIAPENLNRIFAHGFTTKKDGHGFGLHTSALAAKEMGGTLRAHSDGPGLGALFTLELPVACQRPSL